MFSLVYGSMKGAFIEILAEKHAALIDSEKNLEFFKNDLKTAFAENAVLKEAVAKKDTALKTVLDENAFLKETLTKKDAALDEAIDENTAHEIRISDLLKLKASYEKDLAFFNAALNGALAEKRAAQEGSSASAPAFLDYEEEKDSYWSVKPHQ